MRNFISNLETPFFNEFLAASTNVNLTPTRKVVQLQSQIEEIKKPETWAKAVQGLKSVPEFSEKTCDKSDCEKENLEASLLLKKRSQFKPIDVEVLM